jgi:hypothetical protein
LVDGLRAASADDGIVAANDEVEGCGAAGKENEPIDALLPSVDRAPG